MITILQDYVLNKLADLASNEKLKGIYLNVPANSKFPYVYIGDFASKDLSVFSKKRVEINFKIILYHRDKRAKYNYEIIKEIKNRLISNENILIYFTSEKLITEKDGITEQIALSYRSIVEELKFSA